jgi:hypothetical protein
MSSSLVAGMIALAAWQRPTGKQEIIVKKQIASMVPWFLAGLLEYLPESNRDLGFG